MRNMTHSYTWHDWFLFVTVLITCLTWLVHIFDMTHAYMFYDLFMCMAWLPDMCHMTHSYVWYFVRDMHHVTHACDMTQLRLWLVSCTCVTRSICHSLWVRIYRPICHNLWTLALSYYLSISLVHLRTLALFRPLLLSLALSACLFLISAHIFSVWGGYNSRLLKIVGLYCKKALQKRPIFSKETYNFKEPTTRSHPIVSSLCRSLALDLSLSRPLSSFLSRFLTLPLYIFQPWVLCLFSSCPRLLPLSLSLPSICLSVLFLRLSLTHSDILPPTSPCP